MHLSLLSECYADRFIETAASEETGALAHRNGLLRGLAAMAIGGILLGMISLSTTFHSAEAGQVSCETDARQPAQAAVWWESSGTPRRSDDVMRHSTSPAQPGTAVTLIALRQRFRSACR